MTKHRRTPRNPAERILDPIVEPTNDNIMWAAGFYEGEGCVERQPHTVGVNIVQKDPEVLYWLRDWFGGNVIYLDRAHYKGDSFGRQPIYRWRVGGDKARVFLQIIYPYLSARRKAQIDGTDAFRLTGVKRDTRRPMSEERKAARALMTAKQKMVESQLHYRDNNREMVQAYQREKNRTKYQRNKLTESSQIN
jgi:hypothetical protein